MQVKNSFSVAVPLERVWNHLLDVEAVAPCVPGAQLTEIVSPTEYKGTVTVKLGAVKVSYKGTVELTEVDHEAHRVVMKATGSESRGSGAASGLVTSTIVADGPDRTTVNVVSEVAVTGRVAQFGRNIIQDVSNKLIGDFAKCLESTLSAPAEEPSDARETAKEPARESAGAGSTEPDPDVTASTTAGSSADQAAPRAEAAEVKILPIVADITRTRVASGLRKLARVLDPDKEQ